MTAAQLRRRKVVLFLRVVAAALLFVLTIAVAISAKKERAEQLGKDVEASLQNMNPAFFAEAFQRASVSIRPTWPVDCYDPSVKPGIVGATSCFFQQLFFLLGGKQIGSLAIAMADVWSVGWPLRILLIVSHGLAFSFAILCVWLEFKKRHPRIPNLFGVLLGIVVITVLAGNLIAYLARVLLLEIVAAFTYVTAFVVWISVTLGIFWVFIELSVKGWHIYKEWRELRHAVRDARRRAKSDASAPH